MFEHIHGGDIYAPRIMHAGARLVDFSANINPLGLPVAVKAAISENMDAYAHYPDPFCRELRQALSCHLGVESKHIFCANGAADAIYRLVWGLKPKRALVVAPTFAEYAQALQMMQCEIHEYALQEEHGFQVREDILQQITQGTEMVFFCNPNNPTGIITPKELLLNIARECKEEGAVFVFLPHEQSYSMLPHLAEFEQMVILKAFTKLYAMAGIRLGYMLCQDARILQAVQRAGQPWGVSVIASKCGVAALGCTDYVQKTKALIQENRAYLSETLKSLGCKVYASQANFLFFHTADAALHEKLEPYGILIRDCSNYRNLGSGFFRIAVKTMPENAYLVQCMREILTGAGEK